MIAWAIYDFGLTEDQFWDLTPLLFNALCKRRIVSIKYQRFANALTASAVYNVNRTKEDQPMLQATDFVMDEEQARAKQELMDTKAFIKKAIATVPTTSPRAKHLEIRRNVIAKLVENGRKDAEHMFNELWPNLKPQEGEE